MCTSKPDIEKYKKLCDDFPNLFILTKSNKPGEVQLTFVHVSIGNIPLGESVTAFSLTGSLDTPSVVLTNINIAFSVDGDKI